MTRLIPLGLWTAALSISFLLAAPISKVELVIGEPHEITIPANAQVSGPMDQPLPSWMHKEGDKLRMIPPPNADQLNTVVIGSMTFDISVREEIPSGCSSGDQWADSIVDGEPLKQWHIIEQMFDSLSDVNFDDIRIVPLNYARTFREVESREGEEAGKGSTVIIVKAKCGQAITPAVEFMYETGLESVSMVKGTILARSARKEDPNSVLSSSDLSGSTDEPIGEELPMQEATTLPSSTTTRYSRSPAASNPVALVSIKKIECKQGAFCSGDLEEKTFLGGDGGVETFKLTIESLSGNKSTVRPWVIKDGKKRSIGVIPLEAGTHTFRLMGLDKKEKLITAPFSVIVTPDAPKNHQFKMLMHSLPSEPEYLHTTMVKLASFLRRNRDEIRVVSVSEAPAVITYWNTSLPTTSCTINEVSQWLKTLHKKGDVNSEFARAFTNNPTIHPKRLEVQWLGKCEAAAAAAAEGGVNSGSVGGVGAAGAAGKLGEEEPSAEEAESSLSTLITIVAVLALLLALLILIVCCVACKRQKKNKGGVNEYMSKGTPVVFPDEVDDEQADVPASAPMLVKEERPPLRVSEHSNPLYKPPPPLSAAVAASPRPSAAHSAHKLPPPYVPP